MASVFKKNTVTQERSVIEIVRDSLDVDSEGVVRFRSREGRGSGKAVEIPGSQFDEFVTLMVQAQENRETLAKQQCVLEAVTTVVADALTTEDEETEDDTE